MDKELYIVKIGGNVINDPVALDSFIDRFAKLDEFRVLVHGGGAVANKISEQLGITPLKIEGRRVTDLETLKVVTMVYAGLVNKQLVAQLQAKKINALGLTGADGNTIEAHKRVGSRVDYGFVGDIDIVNYGFISDLLTVGTVPVIAPITHDGKGQLLNTNADTIASATANSLSNTFEVSLVYCFELPGVLYDKNDPSSLIETITTEQYEKLKSGGIIADGMIPKLDNCFEALQNGVRDVYIIHADEVGKLGTSSFIGTRLVR